MRNEIIEILDRLKHLLRDCSQILLAITFKINYYKNKHPEAIRDSTELRLREDVEDIKNLIERCEHLIERS